MSIEFQSQTQTTLVNVSCAGTFTLESAKLVFKEGLATAEKNRRSALLVDARNVEGVAPTIVERFHLAEAIAGLQKDYATHDLIRLAIVGLEPVIDPEKFGETVAFNRGAIIRVFMDIDQAIEWLNSDSHK